ncbi:hypothetical protein M885DRAFT_550608 [Pelagophyceae sp. CCMP2097]|nr:hypothetical protein M885DRAFT_550608 [Pelagophyceae sp. CCMP2097]
MWSIGLRLHGMSRKRAPLAALVLLAQRFATSRALKTMKPRIGFVNLRNTQRTFPIDAASIKATTRALLERLGCESFDVGIWLTTDATVRRINAAYRGKKKSTDILSFGNHDHLAAGDIPGKVDVSNEDELNLGDLIVSVSYVQRQILRDAKAGAEAGAGDRGVSAALAKTLSFEDRLPLLIAHGLTHLCGHDHETVEDWNKMVLVEEDLVKHLEDFKVNPPAWFLRGDHMREEGESAADADDADELDDVEDAPVLKSSPKRRRLKEPHEALVFNGTSHSFDLDDWDDDIRLTSVDLDKLSDGP